MSCEHLVCAACAGPVEQARCPVCRAARAEVHHHGASTVPPLVIFAIVAAVALILVVLGR